MTLVDLTTPLGAAGVIARATLLVGIGWSGTRLLRRAPAVIRHLIWLAVIIGVLVTPVLGRVTPIRVAMLPNADAAIATAEQAAGRTAPRTTAGARVVDVPAVASTPRSSPTRRTAAPDARSIALVLWIAVAALLLARLALGILSVGRIIRHARVLQSADWLRILEEAATRLGIPATPRLVMSDQVEMAFAFDALTPTIIVPASAAEWSSDRRRAVLLHELAHIRRRDLVGHTIASVACAIYWFNPFVWAAARRLRIESELASDEIVLESGVRASDYAQHLLDMVTSFRGRTPTVALAMARPNEFEGRLVAILDRANRTAGPGRTQAVAMIGLLGFLTVSIAAIVPVPRGRAATRPTAVEMAPTAATVPTAPAAWTASRGDSATVAIVSPSTMRSADSVIGRKSAPLSEVAIASLLQYGTPAIVNPLIQLLRDADTLELSGKQADSIATLNHWYMARLNALWSPVSSYYLSHPDARHERSVNVLFGDTPRRSMELLAEIVPDIRGVLTEEQQRRLPARISIYLDERMLAAIGAGETSAPGGVFLPNGGMAGGGARRGGRQ